MSSSLSLPALPKLDHLVVARTSMPSRQLGMPDQTTAPSGVLYSFDTSAVHQRDVAVGRGGCDGLSSSSVAGYSICPSVTSRRMREFIPESKKDDEYWMKRQKNNEAAKRSREKRRANDAVMSRRIHELTAENKRLKLELIAIRRQFGLVPGSYTMPPDFPGPTSSSDDSTSSPQPQSHLAGADDGDNENQRQCLASTGRVPPEASDFSPQHRLLERSASGPTVFQMDTSYNSFAGLRQSDGAYRHEPLRTQSGRLDGLAITQGDAAANGAGQSGYYGSNDGGVRMAPGTGVMRMLASESRRSNDVLSVAFSDVSSSDDGGSCEDSNSSHVMSSFSHGIIRSGLTKGRFQMEGFSHCGEAPLNLSAAAVPQRDSFSPENYHSGVRYRSLSLHHPARLPLRRKSVSPVFDVVSRPVFQCALSPQSAVTSSGVDLSVNTKYVLASELHPSDMIPLPSPRVYRSLNDARTVAPSVSVDTTEQVAFRRGVVSRAPLESDSVSLPSFAAFHSQAIFPDAIQPSSNDQSVRWSETVPPPPSSSSSLATTQHCPPSQAETSGSVVFGNSRQVRGGVPLKVWRKRVAMHVDDECDDEEVCGENVDRKSVTVAEDDKAHDLLEAKLVFERRSLSVDWPVSSPVSSQGRYVPAASSTGPVHFGSANGRELFEFHKTASIDGNQSEQTFVSTSLATSS